MINTFSGSVTGSSLVSPLDSSSGSSFFSIGSTEVKLPVYVYLLFLETNVT